MGRTRGLFQTFNGTQYYTFCAKETTKRCNRSMNEEKRGTRKVQDNPKVANKNKQLYLSHVPISLESETSSGSKLRVTVYFLWFIKF